MNTKILVGAVIVFVVFIIVGIIFINSDRKSISPNLSSELSQKSENTLPSKTLKKYIDSSGFIFEYPEEISIATSSALDNSTYSFLKLTSQQVGGMTVKVQDTKLADLDGWEKENKSLIPGKGSVAKLGDISAREYRSNSRLVTAAIDHGILFTIDVDLQKESDYWNSVYNSIFSTFSFSTPKADSSSNSSDQSTGDVVDEGEEVVE